MSTEIERKFLVIGDGWREGAHGRLIRQAYLCATAVRSMRVRVHGDRGFLTIKSRLPATKSADALTRLEYEYEIPVADAHAMLDAFSDLPLVEKVRYDLLFGGVPWTVDVFTGANAGLVLAEVELVDEAEEVVLPDWVGEDVSLDPRYLNVNLAERPYQAW